MHKCRNLLLVLVCLSICSCASSRRMMKISPFSERADMPDEERVNLWPVAYVNDDAVSLLWPIIDVDDDGFAVRPLVNKHQDDWSLLFPLSSYNTSDKEGWLLTGYHTDYASGMFPFFHFGGDFNYLFPVWWTDEGSHGALILYAWGQQFRHLGPAWWVKESNNWGVFPLYGQNISENYVHRRAGLGLLYNHRKRGTNYTSTWVAPLWYSSKDKMSNSQILFPLYYSRKTDKESFLITPLGGRAWNTESDDTTMLNVVGPVYHAHQDGDKTYKAAAWPIFTWSNDGAWRVWPLYSQEKGGWTDPLHSFVLLNRKSTEKHKRLACLPPFIFSANRYAVHDGLENKNTRFLLFGNAWERHYEHQKVPPPKHYNWYDAVYSKRRDFLLTYHEKTRYRAWDKGVLSKEDKETLYTWATQHHKSDKSSAHEKVTTVLSQHGAKPVSKSPEDIWSALNDFTANNTAQHEKVKTGVPLIYRYRSEPGHYDWSFLFGTMKGKRDEDRSHFSIIKLLYRRERQGESVSRDMFPGISWDSSPDAGRVSILWRVFDYRKTDEGRSGHILFIPWG